MKRLAELLKRYVEENLPNSGNGQEVADRLYWCYMERSRIGNDKTNACYAALREKVNLPLREYDEVLYIVSDLCLEHGRQAFLEGLKVGMLLVQEMGKE
jgi:hypothetical protein